jgi:N6-L-threonylcarbamoyladenine synthase
MPGWTLADLDAIAATAGPGLIGGVMVGLVTAKALAMASDKPLIAINHLEGHALSPRLADPSLGFPYLLLLVSGGHCQIAAGRRGRAVSPPCDHDRRRAGRGVRQDRQDPGPGLSRRPGGGAAGGQGDARKVPLPRPLLGSAEPHFSFAGLKSAVLRARDSGLYADADIAASFQLAAVDCIIDRTRKALDLIDRPSALVVAGGVAANQAVRGALEALAANRAWPLWRRRWRCAPTMRR